MKVIGIDPGISATGYSIIENKECLCLGTIRPQKNEPGKKILEICEHIQHLVEKHRPDYAALEKVFYHKNVQSLIRASELRGAIILTLLKNKIEVTEYTPSQIKLTTTGNGRASKVQVRYFIEKIIVGDKKRRSLHATDAIAIAYTATRKMSNKL